MTNSTPESKEMTEEKSHIVYDTNSTMRGRTLLLVGILSAVVAALLLIFRLKASVGGIVVVGGVLFVGAGVFNLLFFNNGTGFNRLLTSVTNSAAIVLGVCMLVFRGTFEPMVPFIFGLIVALCALWQFYALAVGIRPFTLPAWYYFIPLALSGFSIFLFVRKDNIDNVTILTTTGLAIAIFALGAIIEGAHTGVLHRKASPGIEDSSADLDDPIGENAKEPSSSPSSPTRASAPEQAGSGNRSCES